VRENAAKMPIEDVLQEELVQTVKEAAQLSMGTEVSTEDIEHVVELCNQVIHISEYRAQLDDYLKTRMMAIAPNLTEMVGVLIGARLIARAGSLMNLAKYPASTVQILGAEKALFSALKKKQATPKYGILYHASLVGQATAKNKGKISRVLAAKTSLAVRVDALGESDHVTIGLAARAAVEHRLKQLESGASVKASSQVRKAGTPAKYDASRSAESPALGKEKSGKHDAAQDISMFGAAETDGAQKTKKEKKETKKEEEEEASSSSSSEEESSSSEEEKKKKKDKKKSKKDKKDKKEKSKDKKRSRDESNGDKKKKKKSKKSSDSEDSDSD